MQTNPATAPEAAPSRVGLPVRIPIQEVQAKAAAAAEKWVLQKGWRRCRAARRTGIEPEPTHPQKRAPIKV